jgi:hypothetical protein
MCRPGLHGIPSARPAARREGSSTSIGRDDVLIGKDHVAFTFARGSSTGRSLAGAGISPNAFAANLASQADPTGSCSLFRKPDGPGSVVATPGFWEISPHSPGGVLSLKNR